MGTPDTLSFPCPHCGKTIYTQTKPGGCDSFDWETADGYDIARFSGPEECYECRKWCELGVDVEYSNKRIIKLDKCPWDEEIENG